MLQRYVFFMKSGHDYKMIHDEQDKHDYRIRQDEQDRTRLQDDTR